MNARGIALAADSAVTLGDGQKIYLSAEKLFELAPTVPVGIMTYGTADLMGVPWETVVAGYRKHLGDRHHDTLPEYLETFAIFIVRASGMFPEVAQQENFARAAGGLWYALYDRPWNEELSKHRQRSSRDRFEVLRRLIAEDHPKWEQHPLLERIDAGFPDMVIAAYGGALKEAERDVFGPDELPADIRESLNTTLRLFLSRATLPGPHSSGLIIAGMGETEHFPSLLHCWVGPIVKGRLKLHIFDHAQVTRGDEAMIIPFAQREIIDTIIRGIHPDLAGNLPTLLASSLKAHTSRRKGTDDNISGIVERFQNDMRNEISEKYSEPLMTAVAAMPRQELVMMAEVLVSLTAFRAHASVGEEETVAGPIDVAILSKSEGFVWVKRKRFNVV
jgi:hypothetical protein